MKINSTLRTPAKAKVVLIVAPHFPPATLAGVHRARHLAKWLPAHGWTPVVIRVDERHSTESLDPLLADLVPDTVIQERIGAISATTTRKVGISDVSLRSYLPMRQAIAKAVAKYHPKAVFITGSPYYHMLLSGWIKRRFGLPVVLDFQDPWVSSWGASLPRWSKGGLAHQLAVALEPRAIRHAAYITSVSDRQNEELAKRYPWIEPKHMAGIPIGGDIEDFDQLRVVSSRVTASRHLTPGAINISYVGTFLPRAEQVIRRVFQGLAMLVSNRPALASSLRLNFIGTSNQPDGTARIVHPIAASEDVGHMVTETPSRIPFLEALQVLVNSNGLMLIGSDEPHYTASKIYPALMSGTPYLSLFHSASSAHAILSRAGGGIPIAFDDYDDLDRRVPNIAQAFAMLVDAPATLSAADPRSYADYTADSISQRFADIFDQVS